MTEFETTNAKRRMRWLHNQITQRGRDWLASDPQRVRQTLEILAALDLALKYRGIAIVGDARADALLAQHRIAPSTGVAKAILSAPALFTPETHATVRRWLESAAERDANAACWLAEAYRSPGSGFSQDDQAHWRFRDLAARNAALPSQQPQPAETFSYGLARAMLPEERRGEAVWLYTACPSLEQHWAKGGAEADAPVPLDAFRASRAWAPRSAPCVYRAAAKALADSQSDAALTEAWRLMGVAAGLGETRAQRMIILAWLGDELGGRGVIGEASAIDLLEKNCSNFGAAADWRGPCALLPELEAKWDAKREADRVRAQVAARAAAQSLERSTREFAVQVCADFPRFCKVSDPKEMLAIECSRWMSIMTNSGFDFASIMRMNAARTNYNLYCD